MASNRSDRAESPLVPPFAPELLADLHAGVLSDSLAADLWPLVRRDADAMVIIDALDAVTARLRDASQDETDTEFEPIPPAVAERLDRALESAEISATSASYNSVTGIDSPRRVPRRRVPRRAVVVGAAASLVAAIAVIAIVVSAAARSDTGDSSADQALQSETLVVDSNDIDDSLVRAVLANRDSGDLTASADLRICLVANGFPADSTVLGSSPIELDGRRGTMLILPRFGPTGGMTLLAVTADCSDDNPGTLLRRDLG